MIVFLDDELERLVNEFRTKSSSRSDQDDAEVVAKVTKKMKTKPK